MANMARKKGPGWYAIGIYDIQREGSRWVAETGRLGFRQSFPTLAAAYLHLTGEPMRAERQTALEGRLDTLGIENLTEILDAILETLDTILGEEETQP